MSNVCQSQTTTHNEVVWKVVERLDEGRHFPRASLNVPIMFRTGQGRHCSAKLVNLSPDGAQVRCNVATAKTLNPGGWRVSPANSPIFQTRAILPLAEGPQVLSVCARVLYLMRVTEDPCYIIGLKFLDPRPAAKRVLEQFFSEQMEIF